MLQAGCTRFSSGALLTLEHWKEEKRAFEQALVSSTALVGDAVRFAGDGAVGERVQRILHAVAAGGRTAIAKYDS